MSVLASVEKRLEESEQRLTQLIQLLERQQSLEQSLDEAGRGIGEASSNLGELAASTKDAIESLKSVVDLLQETVGILGRSNPAEITETVARIEKELESVRPETRKAIDEVSTQVEKAKVDIGAAVKAETEESIAELQHILEEIAAQQSKSQSRSALISYITLGVVIIVFGIEAFEYFQ